MNYEKEYNFVVNFLNKLNIQTTLFNIDEDEAPKFDLGLRETIYDKDIYKKFFSSFPSTGKPNTIYHINDKFYVNISLFNFLIILALILWLVPIQISY